MLEIIERDHGYKIVYTDNGFYHIATDSSWIVSLKIRKSLYIDTLINKYNAYNNATREFPSIYFKDIEDAERAKEEFYEPYCIMFKLARI